MTAYTQADAADLLRKMEEERDALFATVQSLPEDQLAFVPKNAQGEEQWTGKEQLAHLLESDRMHVAFCRAALEQDGVEITPIRLRLGEEVPIPIEQAQQRTLPDILDAMRAERARAIEFIRSLALPGFSRTGVDDEFGALTVMQWLRSLYRHDRQHGAQIAGRPSDYEPRYLSGREPEQRLARIAKVKAREAPQRGSG